MYVTTRQLLGWKTRLFDNGTMNLPNKLMKGTKVVLLSIQSEKKQHIVTFVDL
jgi:hypothetical protein